MTKFFADTAVFSFAQADCAAFSCAAHNSMIILDASLIPQKRGGGNGFRGFFEAQNADKDDDDWAERHEEVYEVHRSSLSF